MRDPPICSQCGTLRHWPRLDTFQGDYLRLSGAPGFTDAGSYATGAIYSNGTLTYSYNWDAGTEHDFTFSNPAASMGRILRLNVYDTTTGWQAGITRIDYTPSPAAAVANLGSPQQTMDNFSASDAWSMQNVGLWSLTNKTIVDDLLFKTNSGIGLSAWRFNLAAGFDPTVQAGTLWQPWRTENGFLVSSRWDERSVGK